MSSDGTVNSTAPPASAPQTSDPPLQWDGDKMFNIYIHDYCLKRGFLKTANELMVEAQIPPQSQPPINAKQGLLFEWWSVFWVLFTAKSNGNGSPDALLYTQHQSQTQHAKQQRNPTQQGQQQQRFANGVRPPNLPVPQTNGVGSATTQTGPLPNGTQNPGPFPSGAPQPNGVPGSSTGPPGIAGPPQGQGMPQGYPSQRAVPPQQRGMNGASFQSPTITHSPPNPSGPPQQPNAMGSMGPVGANQPLTQMNRGGMHPPNGPQIPMGQQQTPQPAFQQLVGRSPSNPGSPAQNNLVQQSPGLTHRQPPGLSQPSIEMELNRIPPPTLHKIKLELNMGDKDVNVMTIEEKQQLVTQFRRSTMKPPGAGPIQPGQQGPMSHPSGLRNAQLPPNAQQPLPPQGQGPNQQQRGAKRNSTSPGQEPEQLPRNDSSPPANKRPRTSPTGADQAPQQPPMTPMYPHPPQAGGPSMQPPMPPNGGMMRQMQMPFAGQPMTNPMLGHGLGTPQMSPMNPPMNPGMMGGPQGGMVNNPQQMHQYRQAMQTIHKPPHLHMMPGGVPSPSASDPQGGGMPGGPPPGNRMGQPKPMTGMMPPPSPAMAAKTPSKPEDNVAPNASPLNAATGIGGQMSGQIPSTAGPPQVSTPAPPTPNASGMTVPSPSAILNASTPNMASSHPPPPPPPTATDGLDPTSFAGIDFVDFDTNLFNGDSSLNFERDFAAWFDPENAT